MFWDMGCWSGGGRDRWVRSARPVRVMYHERLVGIRILRRGGNALVPYVLWRMNFGIWWMAGVLDVSFW